MAATLLARRGLATALAAASQTAGEFFYTTDTKRLYVSDGTNKMFIGRIESGTAANRAALTAENGLAYYATDTDRFSVYAGGSWNDVGLVIDDGTTSATEVWSSTKIQSELNSIAANVFWKNTVIDYVDCTAVPPTEVSGDRYILDNSGAVHANWDGASAFDIVEFDGTSWQASSPSEGWRCYVDAGNVDRRYVDDGTPAWETIAVGVIALGGISDVTISGVTDNEILAYDNGTSEWINQTAAEAGLASSTHTHAMSDLSDANTSGVADGNFLHYVDANNRWEETTTVDGGSF